MFGIGPIVTFLIIGLVLLASGVKILSEYERAVVFRLGRRIVGWGISSGRGIMPRPITP